MSGYRYLSFVNQQPYRRFIKAGDNLEKYQLQQFEPDLGVHGSYRHLLFDPRWKTRRKEILARDQQACVICKGKHELQVHHRQYHFVVRENKFRLPWEYADYLLITLCEPCHKKGHNRFKVPTINI